MKYLERDRMMCEQDRQQQRELSERLHNLIVSSLQTPTTSVLTIINGLASTLAHPAARGQFRSGPYTPVMEVCMSRCTLFILTPCKTWGKNRYAADVQFQSWGDCTECQSLFVFTAQTTFQFCFNLHTPFTGSWAAQMSSYYSVF